MTRQVSTSHRERDTGQEVETIEPMLQVSKVAKILGVSRSTVYRLAKANELPGADTMGSSVLVRPAPFHAFMRGELDVADWKAARQKVSSS